MSRHLDNLLRLARKLQERYGESDEIVLQLKAEIDVCRAREQERLAAVRPLVERRLGRPLGPCSRASTRIERYFTDAL